MHRSRLLAVAVLLPVIGLLLVSTGCGVIPAPLPNAVEGVTLGTINQIQQDATLTPAERAEILRSRMGLEDDAAGNLAV
ncbi:MAG: hypothetical protein V3T70_10225, partial [Phycisphaerae bacterium]